MENEFITDNSIESLQFSSELFFEANRKYSSISIRSSTKCFYPVVKIAEKMTYSPWNVVQCSGIVIKAQEFLSKNGSRMNGYYHNIVASGGLHSYLGYSGFIILSSIMPDKMLRGFTPDAYGLMIQELQPDFYLTPDGATYLGKESYSEYEINRITTDTEYVILACPESSPIGLVKGCTSVQNKDHVDDLKTLGISRFVFHAGDYLTRGGKRAERKAIEFANIIRENVPWFLVYGITSTRMFLNFRSADGFVTQGHIVNPFYGRGATRKRFPTRKRIITRSDIMEDLTIIKSKMSIIQGQTNISEWVTCDSTPLVSEILHSDLVTEIRMEGH